MLERLADELAGRFGGVFSPATVHRYVFECHTALRRTAKIKTHLGPLTTISPPSGSPRWSKPKEL